MAYGLSCDKIRTRTAEKPVLPGIRGYLETSGFGKPISSAHYEAYSSSKIPRRLPSGIPHSDARQRIIYCLYI